MYIHQKLQVLVCTDENVYTFGMKKVKKMARYNFRVDPQDLQKFKRAAKKNGTTVSSWLRSVALQAAAAKN